jgi:hypothetical protein
MGLVGPTRAHRGMALCWHIDVKSPNAMVTIYVRVRYVWCLVKGCDGLLSSKSCAAKGVLVGSLAGGERQDAGNQSEGRNDGNSRIRAV